MAAAAYAALVSLLNTLDQIQNQIQINGNLFNYFNNYPNESLREKIDVFLDFVEKSSDAESCGKTEDLVRRIAVVAREAEDIIEVHASRAVRSEFVIGSTQRNQKLLLELQRKIGDMDSIKKQIIRINDGSSSPPPATAMVENNSEAQDLARPMADPISAAASTRKRLTRLRKLKKTIGNRFCAFWPKKKIKIDDMDSIKIEEETGNGQHTSSMPDPASSSSATPATPMVENHSEAEDSVRPMAAVALEADEAIQVQPADPINDEQSPSLLPDMHNTNEDVDSDGYLEHLHQEPTSSSAKTNKMVGFDGYLEDLLDQLTRQHSGSLQILPIIGMGGIGKTTLARNVYDNALIVEHFYVRAWVIVSQVVNVREILLQALSCLGGSTSETDKTDAELGDELRKILYGRKYMIVLDDVWSVQDWDKMRSYFPENNNGSRIVITTRQRELVGYFSSAALAIDFLDSENSWELFCENTFAQEGCPPELEYVGRKIVGNCKGLPLAITVVGGLLGRSPRTQEYWEKIAKDKSMILGSEEDNAPWSILYLSYKYLPIWLKSCFLYLGLFPEDHRIKVSQLIKLWIAEGFIKSDKKQSLEEVAENYVKELVDRNLVLVGDSRLNKKPKTCFVHDVVRDLCVRVAEKENVYCVQREIDGWYQFVVDERTARYFDQDEIKKSRYVRPSHAASLVRPIVIFLGQRPEISYSRLLRIFIWDNKLARDLLREVNLRFLIHEPSHNLHKIPPSISRLWSVQTLIFTRYRVTLPCEIWKMPQLRHIKTSRSARLPHPPPSDDMIVLPYLQTLKTVEDFILTEEVCKIIPNIKKLGIIYTGNAQGDEASCSSYHLHNLGRFSKLETLRCSCNGYKYVGDVFRNLKLPSFLKKLSLEGCKLVWSDMAIFGSLPHLQILKLLNNAVLGAEWNCVEGEFLRLKYLQISRCSDLTYWSADSSSFPVLETLSLDYLSKLEEIPSGIEEVPTLEKIQMYECSKSANISAVKMLEEQVENLGNLGLHLQITFIKKWKAEELRKEIEELDITCQNLLIFGKGVDA